MRVILTGLLTISIQACSVAAEVSCDSEDTLRELKDQLILNSTNPFLSKIRRYYKLEASKSVLTDKITSVNLKTLSVRFNVTEQEVIAAYGAVNGLSREQAAAFLEYVTDEIVKVILLTRDVDYEITKPRADSYDSSVGKYTCRADVNFNVNQFLDGILHISIVAILEDPRLAAATIAEFRKQHEDPSYQGFDRIIAAGRAGGRSTALREVPHSMPIDQFYSVQKSQGNLVVTLEPSLYRQHPTGPWKPYRP